MGLTDTILAAKYLRTSNIVELGKIVYGPIPHVGSWHLLGNVEEYSIEEGDNLVSSCSLTLSGSDVINVADYYKPNGVIRITQRLDSDLHKGTDDLIGTFLVDSIEIGTDKRITITGNSTLKLATLKPFVGQFKREIGCLDPSEFSYVTSNYWKLAQYDPGSGYDYYMFVLTNPYMDPSCFYITMFTGQDYVKNWCETNFPIYIAPTTRNPHEDERVYPGDGFEVLYPMGQIRCNKDWWDSEHSGDTFYVGTYYFAGGVITGLAENAGSLSWYKGEMQAYTEDYDSELYPLLVTPYSSTGGSYGRAPSGTNLEGWGWHDEVYARDVIMTLLLDCGFQGINRDALYYIRGLAPTYHLTNVDKILYNPSGSTYIDYTNSSSIPMPGSGEYVYIGVSDRFRQLYLYIDENQPPPKDYQLQWEYCYSDGSGVEEWRVADVVEDETNGWTKSGRIRLSYRGMGSAHYTSRGGVSLFYYRCTPKNFNLASSRAGHWKKIEAAWDASIPDLVLTRSEKVDHLSAITTNVLPYLPPNYKLNNDPDGNVSSCYVVEKEKPDYKLDTIESVSYTKSVETVYTSVRYYGRARFVPNRLSLKDRLDGDTVTLEAAHAARISSGSWDDAFNDNLQTSNGVSFSYPDMSYVRTLFATIVADEDNPFHFGENARFGIIGKTGVARWSVYALDDDTGKFVLLNRESHDFPVEVDEFKVLTAPFNVEYTSRVFLWLWGYNPSSRNIGIRQIGLWETDVLVGTARLGETPPFDTVEYQELYEELGERLWENEEIDELANTQTVVDYRAKQYLSYFMRDIQSLQVHAVRPGVKLWDTVRITVPDVSIDDTFLVEKISRNPNSVVSLSVTSYRTD